MAQDKGHQIGLGAIPGIQMTNDHPSTSTSGWLLCAGQPGHWKPGAGSPVPVLRHAQGRGGQEAQKASWEGHSIVAGDEAKAGCCGNGAYPLKLNTWFFLYSGHSPEECPGPSHGSTSPIHPTATTNLPALPHTKVCRGSSRSGKA